MDVFEALILALLYPLLLPALRLQWPLLHRIWRLAGQGVLWLLLSLAVLLHATWLHKVTVCPLAATLASRGFKGETIKMVLLMLNLIFLVVNILCLHLLKMLFNHLLYLIKACVWQPQQLQQQQQLLQQELLEEQQPGLTRCQHHQQPNRKRRKEYYFTAEPSKTRSGTIYGDSMSKLLSPRTAIRCQRSMSMQIY